MPNSLLNILIILLKINFTQCLTSKEIFGYAIHNAPISKINSEIAIALFCAFDCCFLVSFMNLVTGSYKNMGINVPSLFGVIYKVDRTKDAKQFIEYLNNLAKNKFYTMLNTCN
jgi:hypothetical protein